MALTWSGRRKLMYSGATVVVALILVAFVWTEFFNAAPTCFDGRQDGSETGVDCGGSCSLVCAASARAPQVLWARAFQNGAPNLYTLAAYVQNNNPDAGAQNVQYAFQLYDAENELIMEKDGVTDIPPVQTVPIVEPSVDVGNRVVAHVEFSFDDTYPMVWHTVPQSALPSLRTSGQQLSPDGARLSATIENGSLADAQNVTVVAILFDAAGVARAAAKSLVPTVPHDASTVVTFTWPQENPNITTADITILPSF